MFILRFSNKNSALFVLLAYIPPTLAAAFISISGLVSNNNFFVSSNEKRLVSFLVEPINSNFLLACDKNLNRELPTKPLLPSTNILINTPQYMEL